VAPALGPDRGLAAERDAQEQAKDDQRRDAREGRPGDRAGSVGGVVQGLRRKYRPPKGPEQGRGPNPAGSAGDYLGWPGRRGRYPIPPRDRPARRFQTSRLGSRGMPEEPSPPPSPDPPMVATRQSLPTTRESVTHKFSVM